MAGGVCPRLQPKQARKTLPHRCSDRRRFGSPPLSENEKYSSSPRNSPLPHPAPSGRSSIRLLFLVARPPLLSPGAQTIGQPSDLPLLSGRRIWFAMSPETFDSHLRFAANHHP